MGRKLDLTQVKAAAEGAWQSGPMGDIVRLADLTPEVVREAFEEACARHGWPSCPRCAEKRTYPLKEGRRRCSSCGYTFGLFTRRWAGKLSAAPERWLEFVRAFAEGESVSSASSKTDAAYNTVLKAYNVMRQAILCLLEGHESFFSPEGDLLVACTAQDSGRGGGGCDDCLMPVLTLREDGRGVDMTVHPALRSRDVVSMPLAKKAWRQIIYTEPFKGADSLLFSCCKQAFENLRSVFLDDSLPLDRGSFLYSTERLFSQTPCYSLEKYYLFLAESAFRHDRSPGRIKMDLLDALCRPVPNLAHVG